MDVIGTGNMTDKEELGHTDLFYLTAESSTVMIFFSFLYIEN